MPQSLMSAIIYVLKVIAIHGKVACEIIRNTIGESPLDKL